MTKTYDFDAAKPNKYFGIFFDYTYVTGRKQYKLLSALSKHEINKKIIIPCLKKSQYIFRRCVSHGRRSDELII